MPDKLTIIVPTYAEVQNLAALTEQINQQLSTQAYDYKILIMDDDSNDGSQELVEQLAQNYPIEIQIRKNCIKGLSESVIDGFSRVDTGYIIVMDADLSHPPTAIIPMLNQLQQQPHSFVISSRYIDGGHIQTGWGLLRHLNSQIATLLARPLVRVSDPMSGFFGFHSDDLPKLSNLRPIGYKIGLEVLVKGQFQHIYEKGIVFKDRQRGHSKLTFRQQLLYLRHLRRLYQYKFSTWAELAQFAIIGSIGFVIDLFFYLMLQFVFALPHQWARAISFWPAVTSNWLLNRLITFNQRSKLNPLSQWRNFVISSLVGFSINWGSYRLLTSETDFFDEYKILAMLVGIMVGMGFNFLFSNIFVFHRLRQEEKNSA